MKRLQVEVVFRFEIPVNLAPFFRKGQRVELKKKVGIPRLEKFDYGKISMVLDFPGVAAELLKDNYPNFKCYIIDDPLRPFTPNFFIFIVSNWKKERLGNYPQRSSLTFYLISGIDYDDALAHFIYSGKTWYYLQKKNLDPTEIPWSFAHLSFRLPVPQQTNLVFNQAPAR